MSSADRTGVVLVLGNWLRIWPRRYGFAVLLVAVATLSRYALSATFGPLPPFVIYLPAIILAASLAGFGPGVLATVLSAASVASFFWNSLNVFGSSRPREVVGLVLFCGVGTGMSGLGRLYCRHKSSSEAALHESEDRCRDLVEHSENLVCMASSAISRSGRKRRMPCGKAKNASGWR